MNKIDVPLDWNWLRRSIERRWKRWRYIKISSHGALKVDIRWYAESENGRRQFEALKDFPTS